MTTPRRRTWDRLFAHAASDARKAGKAPARAQSQTQAAGSPDDPAEWRRQVHPAYGALGGYGGGWLRQLLPGSDYDYEAQAGDLWRNSAVAACLGVYKRNFAQPKLEVRRKKGKGRDKVVPGHPLVSLLSRPNPYYDRFAMWSAFCVAAVCDGNAYLMKVRSRAQVPVELWWTPPWLLRPVWDADGAEYVTAYEYRVNGRLFYVRPEDVIHYRHGGPDPRAERLAMSDLKAAAARTVCGLNEVDGYTASIMRNSGVPNVTIEPAAESTRGISRDDAERMKEQWRERTTGERRGDPFITTGMFKVTPIGFSPEQLALDKIPARLEDQVAGLTGVPAMLAGLTAGAQHKTYANYQEARRSFYEDTLIPMQQAVAECLAHNLLDDPGMGSSEREEVVFSYEHILCLQEDQDQIHGRAREDYKAGVIKKSEARDVLGLDWDESDDVYAPVPAASAPAAGDAIDPEGEEGLENRAEPVTDETDNAAKSNPNHVPSGPHGGEFAPGHGAGHGGAYAGRTVDVGGGRTRPWESELSGTGPRLRTAHGAEHDAWAAAHLSHPDPLGALTRRGQGVGPKATARFRERAGATLAAQSDRHAKETAKRPGELARELGRADREHAREVTRLDREHARDTARLDARDARRAAAGKGPDREARDAMASAHAEDRARLGRQHAEERAALASYHHNEHAAAHADRQTEERHELLARLSSNWHENHVAPARDRRAGKSLALAPSAEGEQRGPFGVTGGSSRPTNSANSAASLTAYLRAGNFSASP